MRGKTGSNTCTVVISNKIKSKDKLKSKVKNMLAEQCQDCKHNESGFCSKYKLWCLKAREKCDLCFDKDSRFQTEFYSVPEVKIRRDKELKSCISESVDMEVKRRK